MVYNMRVREVKYIMKKLKYALVSAFIFILCLFSASIAETWQVGNVTVPLSIPTPDGLVTSQSFKDPFLVKTVTTGKIGSYNGGTGCWAFGSYVYRQAFGSAFSKTRHLITPSKTLTPVTAENLKYYILQAGPGAILRTTNQTTYSSSDSDGHTMVIVDADEEGVRIYHASGKGYIYYGNETRYFTWSSFAASIQRGSVSSGKKNIKYVIYPGEITFNDIIAAENAVKVESIQIKTDRAILVSGEEIALTCDVLPDHATNPAVLWSSANEQSAKIDSQTGAVTALIPGNVQITASALDESGVSDTVSLTILPALDDFDMIFPESLKTVKSEAFLQTSARYVRLPDSINAIESKAFKNCQNLIAVHIPASVTHIADDAFEGIENLILWTESEYAAEYALSRGFTVFEN